MKQRQFPCKGCGNGCLLEATYEETELISLKGNRCKNGMRYAQQILLCQILEATLPTADGRRVKICSKEPIPSSKKQKCMEELAGIVLETPVIQGEVILYDAAGSGICIVAAENLF